MLVKTILCNIFTGKLQKMRELEILSLFKNEWNM